MLMGAALVALPRLPSRSQSSMRNLIPNGNYNRVYHQRAALPAGRGNSLASPRPVDGRHRPEDRRLQLPDRVH